MLEGYLYQLLGNTLVLKTVRGDTVHICMQQGLLEGSPISVLAVGLLLTRFLQQLRGAEAYKLVTAALEGDQYQQPIPLCEKCWIDDWVLFAHSADDLRVQLEIWKDLLGAFGWQINYSKTQVMFVSSYPQELEISGCKLEAVKSFVWLGCKFVDTGLAREHVEHRIALATAAWRQLCMHYDYNRLSLRTKNRLYTNIIQPIVLHGCHAFPLTSAEWQSICKLQNTIQRHYFKLPGVADIATRWTTLHRRMKTLRNETSFQTCSRK